MTQSNIREENNTQYVVAAFPLILGSAHKYNYAEELRNTKIVLHHPKTDAMPIFGHIASYGIFQKEIRRNSL